MGCSASSSRRNEKQELSFEEQLRQIDKEEFFKYKESFKIILRPVLVQKQRISKNFDKGETDSQE